MERWIETPSTVKTFRLGEEPELIHVIKTGFNDKYMVVYEDAYELACGEVAFVNAKELLERYGIDCTKW